MDAVNQALINSHGMECWIKISSADKNEIINLIIECKFIVFRNCGEMAAQDDDDMNEAASPCGPGSHSQVNFIFNAKCMKYLTSFTIEW